MRSGGAAAAAAMEVAAAPARQLLLAGLLMGVLAAPTESSSSLVDEQAFVCSVPASSPEGLRSLALWNCDLVNRTIQDYRDAIAAGKGFNDNQQEVWEDKEAQAGEACRIAEALLNGTDSDLERAANYAVNAWGTVIAGGSECCIYPGSPICISNADWSVSVTAVLLPFAVLLLLFAASWLTSWCLPKKREERALLRKDTVEVQDSPGAAARGVAADAGLLEAELRGAWLAKSCLRVLPEAQGFAGASASLFSALREAFDFQADNVRNQHEHLLSLLRSQLSMVADRAYEERGVQVNEQDLLREALRDLHAELLDGFLRWREAFYGFEGSGMEAKGGLPPMCGASWEPLRGVGTGDADEELSRQLAEVVAFLLVWGEAGNLRFMPEVVYFITDLVLSSEPHDLSELYQLQGQPTGDSGLFLARIVRPMYNSIFDEWYDKVDVNPSSSKDVKKLREGFDAHLPGDAANYDDWNELFSDPPRLAAGLLLQDGSRLFEHAHGQRFRHLAAVDWEVSLQARATKTHNELHSLWGVFASTHRVCLLHMVLFAVSLCVACGEPPARARGQRPLGGDGRVMRFAAVGLLVPFHALAWSFARWQVTGAALRGRWGRCGPCLEFLGAVRGAAAGLCRPLCGCPGSGRRCCGELVRRPPLILLLAPLATYALLRKSDDEEDEFLNYVAGVHYLLSAYGLACLLLVPSSAYNRFPFESPTAVPLASRAVRYGFWGVVLAVKFVLGLIIVQAISNAMRDLQLSRPGHQSVEEIEQAYFSAVWGGDVLIWIVLWGATFALYLADTQLWFTVFCTFLGVATTFVQRHLARNGDGCPCSAFMFEDAVAKIPQRFSQKVLCYTSMGREAASAPFSAKFPAVWDRIVEFMRYEDKVSSAQLGDLSFEVGATGHHVYWEDLAAPVGQSRQGAAGAGSQATSSRASAAGDLETGDAGAKRRVKVPNIFVQSPLAERCLQTYAGVPDQHWPQNADVQWRVLALSRGLGLPMPRPYRAPYMPGITVLIPHYGETILMQKKDLFKNAKSDNVPLVDWLTHKYQDEFEFFTTRMQARRAPPSEAWHVVGSEWEKYTDYQWGKVSNWAAMRQQTLFRTVAGMCYYHPAIQAHFEVQGDRSSSLAAVWDPSDVFTCLVSMQMYKFFDKTMLEHTNYMFEKFPKSLKVAFIDCEAKGPAGSLDGVHERQKRRYYSCLIDKTCPMEGDKRRPKFKIELPGYPILGDGKGDNQNHAIPFMRGHYSQGIDANQGAYFEQMMLLPCALGEFRSRHRGDGSSKKILGFPEHITSDIGSVGDFAASAEVAFGTILQRTYAVLGARMHYGHPDIMNKLYMMQQGGVSKATKTLNLSEDIFAGMDFTLRGDGRKIKHCEYLNLAKGRDLGFNTVLGFFSKLSSGTGEQILTRQMFRLGQVLHLPEALTFFYAHAGYYLNQFIVSWSMPLLVWMWLLVLLSDCEGKLDAFMMCEAGQRSAAAVMASALATCYSWLLILFLFATSFPLFAELWMQRNLKHAMWKMVQSYLTLSPFLFIFQSKCIGHYIVNEFRYGGATYVATGRGLPTERRPFVGEMKDRSEGFLKMAKVGGLYLDYASITYYDGAMLLVGLAFVVAAGGIPSGGISSLAWTFVSCALVLIAWLYGPFIFNPYQFELRHFREDARALCAFFLENNGSNWLEWYSRTQLKSGHGLQKTLVDITFFGFVFVVAAWYVTVTVKVELLVSLFSKYDGYALLYLFLLLPPVFASFGFCLCVVVLEMVGGCSSSVRRAVEARVQGRHRRRQDAASGGGRAEDPEAAEPSRRAEDFAAAAPAPRRQRSGPVSERVQGLFGCTLGVPLPATALLVVGADAAELFFALRDVYYVGWTNALLAGVVLKLTLLSAAIIFGEGVLRSEAFARVSACWAPLAMPLEAWVRAHRMARDMFTAALIFLPLSLFVMLNSLNECLCPSCNLHQLCLYRDPGHAARREHEWCTDQAEQEPAPAGARARPPAQTSMPSAAGAPAAGSAKQEDGLVSLWTWVAGQMSPRSGAPDTAEDASSSARVMAV